MNITLIGMPGSGKSHVGKMLADRLGRTFVDPDKLLEEEYRKPLAEVVSTLGERAFLAEEAKRTMDVLKMETDAVIATGGSIVYSEDVMQMLSEDSTIVYLEVDRQQLEKRIGEMPRGIVKGDAKTFSELYDERVPLYKKWAKVTVNGGEEAEHVVGQISSRI